MQKYVDIPCQLNDFLFWFFHQYTSGMTISMPYPVFSERILERAGTMSTMILCIAYTSSAFRSDVSPDTSHALLA